MNTFIGLKEFKLIGYDDCSDIAIIVDDYEFSGKEILNIANTILDKDQHLTTNAADK